MVSAMNVSRESMDLVTRYLRDLAASQRFSSYERRVFSLVADLIAYRREQVPDPEDDAVCWLENSPGLIPIVDRIVESMIDSAAEWDGS